MKRGTLLIYATTTIIEQLYIFNYFPGSKNYWKGNHFLNIFGLRKCLSKKSFLLISGLKSFQGNLALAQHFLWLLCLAKFWYVSSVERNKENRTVMLCYASADKTIHSRSGYSKDLIYIWQRAIYNLRQGISIK